MNAVPFDIRTSALPTLGQLSMAHAANAHKAQPGILIPAPPLTVHFPQMVRMALLATLGVHEIEMKLLRMSLHVFRHDTHGLLAGNVVRPAKLPFVRECNAQEEQRLDNACALSVPNLRLRLVRQNMLAMLKHEI